MKKFSIRALFLAFALLSVGVTPMQARASNGGCDGRSMVHRKPEDVRDYVLVAWRKVFGHHCFTPQVTMKVIGVSYGTLAHQAFLGEPPTMAEAQPPALPLVLAYVPMAPAPIAVAEVEKSTEPATTVPAPAAPKPASVKAQHGHRTYEAVINIPTSTAKTNGIVPGTFPALLMENQKQGGEWSKQHKMVVTVEETANGYFCHIVLRAAPNKNSAVAVDFENGNSLVITSDLLSQGAVSQIILPKPKKKKSYVALNAAYPVKQSIVVTIIRFAAPTMMHAGMGFAFGSTIGLITSPVTLVTSIAMKKIEGNRRALAAEQHPSLHIEYALAGQQDQIDTLKNEVELLKTQIRLLGQTANNPNSTRSSR